MLIGENFQVVLDRPCLHCDAVEGRGEWVRQGDDALGYCWFLLGSKPHLWVHPKPAGLTGVLCASCALGFTSVGCARLLLCFHPHHVLHSHPCGSGPPQPLRACMTPPSPGCFSPAGGRGGSASLPPVVTQKSNWPKIILYN